MTVPDSDHYNVHRELSASLAAYGHTLCGNFTLGVPQLLLQLPGLCYCPRCDPASPDYRPRRNIKTELCRYFATGECVMGTPLLDQTQDPSPHLSSL